MLFGPLPLFLSASDTKFSASNLHPELIARETEILPILKFN